MLKKYLKSLTVIFALSAIFGLAGFALAAAPDLGLGFGNSIGLSNADPRTMAANIIRIALAFLGIIAVALIVYGGFLWMTAAGNEDQIDRAKKTLISAVIGLIIILAAFGIATFLLNSILNATGGGSTNNPPGGGGLPPGGGGPGASCSSGPFGSCVPVQNCQPGLICDNNCICQPAGGPGSPCSASSTACVIDNNLCNGNSYCDNSCICQAKGGAGASCNSTTTPGICVASGNKCLNGFFCDPNANPICTCQPGNGVGQSCDSDPVAPGCQADQTICSNELVCDTTNPDPKKICTCQDNPVIDWVSPAGGLCSDDNTKTCLVDTDCAGPAAVCNLNTPSAAAGNIISIGGVYFGAAKGKVYFSDGSAPTVAGIDPASANPLCVSSWTDTQIIIVVPASAKTGAIRVERTDGKTDDTNDARGPLINDLQLNGIVKPGLCNVNKPQGRLGDSVSYNGINFSNAGAEFGSYSAALAGKNSSFAAINGTANVPNLAVGQTTTFVANAGGQNSNYLQFTKLAEPNTGPYIVSFDPVTGAPGQYVTIRGSGFGDIRGASEVYFGDENTGTKANYQFPDICAASVWTDKQIIVKVPAGLADGGYLLTIALGAGKIINTSGMSPANFTADSSLGLSPSLCRISPVLGQVNTTVDLWGEYFGAFDAATSRIKFFSNIDVAGQSNLPFWGPDNQATGAIHPDKVETKVPLGAGTGPVKVVKDLFPNGGNGLNFQVGSCLDSPNPDAACGAQKCCPAGTYKAGVCVNNIATDCVVDIPTSVYEFDFNTGVGNALPGTVFTSCQEKSLALGTCDETSACPNSPGSCSPFFPSPSSPILQNIGVVCDNSSCTGKPGCAGSACVYNSSMNKCVDKNAIVCGLPVIVKDALGKDAVSRCSLNLQRYIIDNSGNTSCPSGWVKQLDNLLTVCVNQNGPVCKPCASGLECVDPGSGAGICAAPGIICPAGSKCNSGACQKAAAATCSCCCRKANANEDCCAGLTCTGTCGKDIISNTNTFGSCGGCKTDSNNDGTIDSAEQALSDAKCNCSGTTGKACDVNDPGFSNGVCRDCASLSDPASCTAHNSACCVDGEKGNVCRGISNGTPNASLPADPNAYCGYFQCNKLLNTCGAPQAKPASDYYDTLAGCTSKCAAPALLGASCQSQVQANSCALNICSAPFACLLSNGSQATNNPIPNGCGFCCCDPSKAGTPADSCLSLGSNSALACRPDQTPCSGGSRGLCCGCSANADCGNAVAVGCGADTCCRARPAVYVSGNIASTTPQDGDAGVCANAVIAATFDQMMNVESFSGNAIVAGEYPSGTTCPQGTAPLVALANEEQPDKNLFARALGGIDHFWHNFSRLFGRETLASAGPDSSHVYCAIAGSAGGEQLASKKTKLIFRPRSLLNAGRKYFVIIKGDSDVNKPAAGVRSLWDIGMDTPAGNIAPARVDNASSFGALTYPGAYIWSFTVLPDIGGNKGLCAVDHAKIIPASYLFQTTANDLNENDANPSARNFDTIADSDKVFSAEALSANGQVLHSVIGYAWQWSWVVVDPNAAAIVNPSPFAADPEKASQLIRAAATAVDKKTTARATITLTDKTLSSAGDGVSASADIYVFICENPWPPFQASGDWYPWRDKSGNCDAALGAGCDSYNYEFYYCRDQGDSAPLLPNVSDGELTTRGTESPILKQSLFIKQ